MAKDKKVFKKNVGRIIMHRDRKITVLQNHLQLGMDTMEFEKMVLNAIPAEFEVLKHGSGIDSHGTPENGFVRCGITIQLADSGKAPALRKIFNSLLFDV